MFEPVKNPDKTTTTRAVQLALVGVIGLSLVGLAVGLRQGTPVPELQPPAMGTGETGDAIRPYTYAESDRRQWGVNRGWKSRVETLHQTPVDLAADYADLPKRPEDSEAYQNYLLARASRRAFDGAPPVVPHPVDQMNPSSCLVCHQNGMEIGKGVWAPAMSHPYYPSCNQCHAEGTSTEFTYEPLAENRFSGEKFASLGTRAWEGAPPTIPHPVFMRETCLSCHGNHGANPIRTSHPWRVSCTQCHAPSAELDQVFIKQVRDQNR